MSSVTVPTKDVGDVRDIYRDQISYKKSLEDMNEEYIKKELRI